MDIVGFVTPPQEMVSDTLLASSYATVQSLLSYVFTLFHGLSCLVAEQSIQSRAAFSPTSMSSSMRTGSGKGASLSGKVTECMSVLSSLVPFEIEYRTAVDRLLARAEKLRREARGMLKTHVTMLAWHVAESVAELGEAVGAEVSPPASAEGAELGEAELGAMKLGDAV